jgi:hypothetical protein
VRTGVRQTDRKNVRCVFDPQGREFQFQAIFRHGHFGATGKSQEQSPDADLPIPFHRCLLQ